MFVRWPWKRKPDQPSREQGRMVYKGLRDQALGMSREEVGLPPLPEGAPAWLVLMEFGFPSGTATILGFLSGAASLYIDSGGGIIGGEGHAAIREAAIALVHRANQHQDLFQPTTELPSVRPGWVAFCLRTEEATLTATAPESELRQGCHPLTPLFLAGNDVLTQLRIITEE